MNPVEADLYKRICEFNLDESGASFPFSHKLAREYQWKRVYTLRAIQEYRKFIFLGTICDQILSPPVPVDLVWHLHLIYTHSYWTKFCGEILGKPFHHSPSLGGEDEKLKYDRLYQQTLVTYQLYFGSPPSDIWLDSSAQKPHQRCQTNPNFLYWSRD